MNVCVCTNVHAYIKSTVCLNTCGQYTVDPDGHVIDINRMASHSLSLPVLACNVSTKKLDLQTPCCVCLKEGRLCFALLCFGNQKSFWSSCQQSLGHLFVLLGRVNCATVRNEILKNETHFPGDGGWAAEMSRTSIQNRHHRHQAGGKNIGFYTQLCSGTAE